MASIQPTVRRALASERAPATDALAQAFADDPIMSWMIGPNRDISGRVSHLFGHMLGVELDRGGHLVDIADDCDAVALWHDVDQWKASPRAVVKMVVTIRPPTSVAVPPIGQLRTAARTSAARSTIR